MLRFAVLFCLVAASVQAAERFPGQDWNRVAPDSQGWSADGLARARAWSQRVGPTAAVMIVHRGAVVAEWGDTTTKSNLHSVRKSLLSALIGIAVSEGKLDLAATLDQLGIDDNAPALTPAEKAASVHDLLKARSGVYHPALYETPQMAASRPPRGTHPPGTFWYYNNWDFNALGTIYEQATGDSIFTAFDRRIARPIGMQDYQPVDGEYVTGKDSIHRAYPIRMSARDLARFALLYLRKGEWNGQRIVSADWVAASAEGYSAASFGSRYGYMWWVDFIDIGTTPTVKLPPGSYSAQGFLGQYAFIIPAFDLVIVHRINSDRLTGDAYATGQVPGLRGFARLLWLILSAAGAVDIGPDATLEAARGTRLTGAELERTLSGATLHFERNGAFQARVQADGVISYRRGPALAEYETARWSIEEDRFCRARTQPRPAKDCHAVVLDGASVQLYDKNGLMEWNAGLTRE
jgi:CubicO group peptidase (beta-lactamase class C family)